MAALLGCHASPNTKGKKIGIAFPPAELIRWSNDGKYLKKKSEDRGYRVDLRYASNNDVEVQSQQIEELINNGCDILVITAVDASSLNSVLAKAADIGIPVIAYDRLLMYTDAVSYYVTFDNSSPGKLHGTYIEEKLKLKAGGNSYNIEFFSDFSRERNTAIDYFQTNVLRILQPYLDSGVLKCPSGQIEGASVLETYWSSQAAYARMKELIVDNNYGVDGIRLDAVICATDTIAQGVSLALVEAGYSPDNFPVITGQDCEIISVNNIIAGTQTMSLFYDTLLLIDGLTDIIEALSAGQEPFTNDKTNYDNGRVIVPTLAIKPLAVTIDNYREKLIDSGYYTQEQLKQQ